MPEGLLVLIVVGGVALAIVIAQVWSTPVKKSEPLYGRRRRVTPPDAYDVPDDPVSMPLEQWRKERVENALNQMGDETKQVWR